jgi:predicted anti-sigma-YlaC factor YlaD
MAGMDPPIPISSPGRLIVVQHIPEEAMEFYAMRTLPDFEIEPLEEHLLMCPECRDRFMAAMGAVEKPRAAKAAKKAAGQAVPF